MHVNIIGWIRICWALLRRKFVLVLGSLHLTVMAALGIWLWSSPYRYEDSQAHRLHLPPDLLPLRCTETAILGLSIPLTSAVLNRVSVVLYSIFLAPGLNLVIPAIFFLLLFIRYGKASTQISIIWRSATSSFSSEDDVSSCHESLPGMEPPIEDAPASVQALHFVDDRTTELKRIIGSVAPISAGLLFLLAINIVFIADIETSIHRAAQDESKWTFGQTLALLLLVLPIRDVYNYIKESIEAEHAETCTQRLKQAVLDRDLNEAFRAAKYADDVRVYINSTLI
jgi:hypothetical protein